MCLLPYPLLPLHSDTRGYRGWLLTFDLLFLLTYILFKSCNIYSFHHPLSTCDSLLCTCSMPLTYEMTSPMRVSYCGLGVARYIPPTIAVLAFKSHCLARRLSTLLVPPMYLPALRIDPGTAHVDCRLPLQTLPYQGL